MERVRANQAGLRTSASKGALPNFELGKYVTVARASHRGGLNKLEDVCGTRWVVPEAGCQYSHGVEDIVMREGKKVKVARVSPYVDEPLAVTADLLRVSKH